MTGPGLGETLTQIAAEDAQAAEAAKAAADAQVAADAATAAAGGEGATVTDAEAAAAAEAARLAAAPKTLDVEGLPTELRGKTPQEVSDLWNLMRQSLSAAAYAREQPVAQPAAVVEPEDEKSLKDLIIEEPEKALAMWAERNYGPMLRNIAAQSQESAFLSFRDTFADFKDQEPKVRRIINSLGISADQVTRDHITAAYYMAKGIGGDSATRADASLSAASAAAAVTESPTPQQIHTEVGKLDDVSSEVAKRMGMDEKTFVEWRDMSDADYNAAHVKVPMAAKDFGRTGKKE